MGFSVFDYLNQISFMYLLLQMVVLWILLEAQFSIWKLGSVLKHIYFLIFHQTNAKMLVLIDISEMWPRPNVKSVITVVSNAKQDQTLTVLLAIQLTTEYLLEIELVNAKKDFMIMELIQNVFNVRSLWMDASIVITILLIELAMSLLSNLGV